MSCVCAIYLNILKVTLTDRWLWYLILVDFTHSFADFCQMSWCFHSHCLNFDFLDRLLSIQWSRSSAFCDIDHMSGSRTWSSSAWSASNGEMLWATWWRQRGRQIRQSSAGSRRFRFHRWWGCHSDELFTKLVSYFTFLCANANNQKTPSVTVSAADIWVPYESVF